MPILSLIVETRRDKPNAERIARWRASVERQGYTTTYRVVDAAEPVRDVLRAINSDCPGGPGNRVQAFGSVPVPQLWANKDGHGYRPTGCWAPYCTDGPLYWPENPDGTYGQYGGGYWAAPPVRGFSSFLLEGLSSDETALLDTVLDDNYAFRTGTYQFNRVGLVNNRLDYLGISTAAMVASLTPFVGTDNVLDVTRRYPDEAFFETYDRWKSFFLAYLFSGGDGFRESDLGLFGHEYYLDLLSNILSRRVRILGSHIFCSHGHEMGVGGFRLQDALIGGGGLWTVYDLEGGLNLSAWSPTVPIGDAHLLWNQLGPGSLFTDMIQGDGSLLLPGDQPMGMTATNLDALLADVAGLKTDVATLQTQVLPLAALPAQVEDLAMKIQAGGSTPPPPDPTLLHRVHYGLGVVPGWQANVGLVQGKPWPPDGPISNPIDVSGLATPVPASVYQGYIGNPTTGGALEVQLPIDPSVTAKLKVRLHFTEPYYTSPGRRPFNVKIGGQQVLTSFDPAAYAKASFKAIALDFDGVPQGGVLDILCESVGGSYPMLCAVEVWKPGATA